MWWPQVLVEVYASQNLDIKPHLLLSLVLYKMVDPQLVCPSSTQVPNPPSLL